MKRTSIRTGKEANNRKVGKEICSLGDFIKSMLWLREWEFAFSPFWIFILKTKKDSWSNMK